MLPNLDNMKYLRRLVSAWYNIMTMEAINSVRHVIMTAKLVRVQALVLLVIFPFIDKSILILDVLV